MSSDEQVVDQAMGTDQGSGVSKRSRPIHWDVKPLIPILPIQPRRAVTKELRRGGSTSGLTSRRPQTNEELE